MAMVSFQKWLTVLLVLCAAGQRTADAPTEFRGPENHLLAVDITVVNINEEPRRGRADKRGDALSRELSAIVRRL